MQPIKIPKADHPELVKRYRAGETLQQIADTYGVSRERVRQLLDRMGVRAQEGGQAYRTKRKKKANSLKRERRFLRKYGMTREQFREVETNVDECGGTPYLRFREQKGSAHTRGIEWNLTFGEWWSLWEASGQWSKRGRGKGRYVMSRPGDTGPYELGNVAIVQSQENNREFINRYWTEVHSGKRELGPAQARGPRGSRYGFHLLVDQDRVVVEDTNTRNVQAQALNYARMHGWKVKTKTSGDRVTVERVA